MSRGSVVRALSWHRGLAACTVLAVALAHPAAAQQPLDLFADEPPLAPEFVRIGTWNLRHIDLDEEAGTADFLPGMNENEDFAILIATFAKAIEDLDLDLLAVVEHQPRSGEPNRLHQLRDALNGGVAGPWRADESRIAYDDPDDPFGNLQLAVLWNSNKVTIDPARNRLLEDLRQPRDESGQLTKRTRRAPWLVPVRVGSLDFDLIVLHLTSGGNFPQQQEVDALEVFLRQHMQGGRQVVLCGDWNIRPDRPQGRVRLRQLSVPNGAERLLRVLTVEDIPPNLSTWESLESRDLLRFEDPVSGLVSFSHFNATSLDTFLDHLALSRGLLEVFENPVRVGLAAGGTDLRPGIRVAVPMIREEDYHKLTDHLPVVLTLRTDQEIPDSGGATPQPGGLRIAAVLPNPFGNDAELEEVRLANRSDTAEALAGWTIRDAAGSSWVLVHSDGAVEPGAIVRVLRRSRPMALDNTGDTLVLVDPSGREVDTRTYGPVAAGEVVEFPGSE